MSNIVRGRRTSLALCVALAVTLSSLVYFGHPFLLRALGSYLVVEDPLERAPAVVVLAGEVPFRAMEAGQLYKEGWSPKIVLTRGKRDEAYHALEALGIKPIDYNREVLLRLGIPASAVLLIEEEVENTFQELSAVLRLLQDQGWGRVIVVTSKTHSRRVAQIWRYLTHGQQVAIIRWARRDPYTADGWWKKRTFAFVVLREYLGLVNLWLGLPMG